MNKGASNGRRKKITPWRKYSYCGWWHWGPCLCPCSAQVLIYFTNPLNFFLMMIPSRWFLVNIKMNNASIWVLFFYQNLHLPTWLDATRVRFVVFQFSISFGGVECCRGNPIPLCPYLISWGGWVHTNPTVLRFLQGILSVNFGIFLIFVNLDFFLK